MTGLLARSTDTGCSIDVVDDVSSRIMASHLVGGMDADVDGGNGCVKMLLEETDLRRHDDLLKHHFGGRVGYV